MIEFELPELRLDRVSEKVMDKAKKLRVARYHITDGRRIVTVEGSKGDLYTVTVSMTAGGDPALAFCNCPWGQANPNGTAGCSHIVAALLKIKNS